MILKLNTSNTPQKSLEGVEIVKITSSISALEFIPLFLNADNKVNPRNATDSNIVQSIQETLETNPELFSYKTKGILVSSKTCKILERNRVRLSFDEPMKEGIMDGGHNVLAIAGFIADKYNGTQLRKWQDAKIFWKENYSDLIKFVNENNGDFGFSIPIEIITTDNSATSEEIFNSTISDICSARNNNRQLNREDKSHQRGHYDYLKRILDGKYKIQWKDGEGGEIKSKDVVTLSTIPLQFIKDNDLIPGLTGGINPTNIYSGKNHCLAFYDKVITLDSVSKKEDGRIIIADRPYSGLVKSALRMTDDILQYHDRLFVNFGKLYNRHGGSYGSITEVKSKSNSGKSNRTPKFRTIDKVTELAIFDPYILPLVYGLISLIKYDEDTETLTWKKHPSTIDLTKLNLNIYKNMMTTDGFNPQKIGKNAGIYMLAEEIAYSKV